MNEIVVRPSFFWYWIFYLLMAGLTYTVAKSADKVVAALEALTHAIQ